MKDYIGRYVKQFESGNKGSLCLAQCGNDYGLSCGSYQFTLRWGNCILFLKRYFPEVARDLYFNNLPDIKSAKYPGARYCSSPEQVKKVWMLCYESVGEEKFFEYEHNFTQSQYYEPLMKKLNGLFNPNNHSRALQECLWSWSVHKGTSGAYIGLKSLSIGQNMSVTTLLNKIYDYRYNVNATNRYSCSKTSERSVLLEIKDVAPLPYNGSNKSTGLATGIEKQPTTVPSNNKGLKVGLYRIISEGGMNVRRGPGTNYEKFKVVEKGEAFTFVEFVGDWGLLKSYAKDRNGWINCNPKYCKFIRSV